MECLRDYIGLKGCEETIPSSGLFINSLPGINLKSIDKIADHEQISFKGVWKDIQDRTLAKFNSEVQAAMLNKYRIVNCGDCTVEAIVCDQKEKFNTTLWYMLGVELMAERIYSDRLNRYTTIDLQKAKDLRVEFEVEAQRLMSLAIDSLDCSECIECDPYYDLVPSTI